MSNITPFPKRAFTREEKRKQQAELAESMRKQGGLAIENLSSWRRSIPLVDRVRMAKNMNAIIDTYLTTPSKLDWKSDYGTAEDFRRDVHRMRLPETAELGKKQLIAYTSKWVQLLNYICKYAGENGESVSLELLADRLTRGTRFHPTKKEQTKSEKTLYLLNGWANELDEKLGLLSTYKRISKARSEYYRIHRYGIHSIDKQPEWGPASQNSRPSDELTVPSDEFIQLFNKEFQYFSEDDWKTLFKLIQDDSGRHYEYQSIQREITDWKNTYSQDGTLISYEMNTPALCWGDDIPFLPHWFVGFCADSEENVITKTSDHWLAEIIREQGTVDPITLGQKVGWELNAVYLVLYPDAGLNRIVPYVYYLSEEASDFETINQSYYLEHGKYFQPKGVNETTVSQTLLRRVEESMRDIYESWEVTSHQLASHPYLAWKKGQEEMIDREIESMLTRTGRIKPKSDRG